MRSLLITILIVIVITLSILKPLNQLLHLKQIKVGTTLYTAMQLNCYTEAPQTMIQCQLYTQPIKATPWPQSDQTQTYTLKYYTEAPQTAVWCQSYNYMQPIEATPWPLGDQTQTYTLKYYTEAPQTAVWCQSYNDMQPIEATPWPLSDQTQTYTLKYYTEWCSGKKESGLFAIHCCYPNPSKDKEGF